MSAGTVEDSNTLSDMKGNRLDLISISTVKARLSCYFSPTSTSTAETNSLSTATTPPLYTIHDHHQFHVQWNEYAADELAVFEDLEQFGESWMVQLWAKQQVM